MAAVVVGYVPRPEGEAALLRAVDEARLRSLDLVVVNSQREDHTDEEWVRKTESDLAAARERLARSGVRYELRETVAGPAGVEELVTIAEEADAQLVVIGIRRRSPVGKLILGTRAQRIMLDAPCPVLAVKA
jgi:nucleotide-binding universal stress UspA family protein